MHRTPVCSIIPARGIFSTQSPCTCSVSFVYIFTCPPYHRQSSREAPLFLKKTQRSLLSCTFSNPSASPLCSCLPPVPTAASVSWQNIEGKFHGWWRRCENVTLWAINKEVWLTLAGPFFTWVCFAAFLASFFSPLMYTFLSSAVVHELLICIGKNFLMHFNFYTHPHTHTRTHTWV